MTESLNSPSDAASTKGGAIPAYMQTVVKWHVDNGATLLETANRFGLSEQWVRRCCVIAGVYVKKKHPGSRTGPCMMLDPVEVTLWRLTNNASIKEAALHFGLSSATVIRYCKIVGVQFKGHRGSRKAPLPMSSNGVAGESSGLRRGRPLAADPNLVADWRTARGATLSETAKHFGISIVTACRYCNYRGEKPTGRPVGRPLATDPNVVYSWREAHKATIKATAKHFDLSEATVFRYCSQQLDLRNQVPALQAESGR